MAGIIRTVKVGDKDITFTSNGATFILYQQAFGKDGLREFEKLSEEPGSALYVIQEFAYIMSGAYTRGEAYIDWLSQFGMLDIPNAAGDIISLLNDDAQTFVIEEGKNTEAVDGQ